MGQKILFWFSIIWVVIAILYLFSGVLVVLVSEPELISLFKSAGTTDVISAIATCISAIAAFMAYRAAEKSAAATKDAATANEHLVILSLVSSRQRLCNSLCIIWNYLNFKCCYLAYTPKDPDKFLVTQEEIDLLEKQREIINNDSFAYGKDFQESIRWFYKNLLDELSSQTSAGDVIELGECGLTKEHQEEYLKFRNESKNKAFELLEEVNKNLLSKPPF